MNFVKSIVLLAVLTALFMAVGYIIGGTGGMLLALVFAAGTNAWTWWNSDKLALKVHNAQPATPAGQPELHALVARLAQRAGLPMPKVFLIPSEQPNAFATGRNPENAAVAITTGLLAMLGRDEVEGVIAHELAHIEHRDTLTMTVAATFAGAISMLAQFGFWFGRGGSNRNPLGGFGVLLAVLVAPVAAMLVQMTISRTREYSADRRGAEISGKPLALASALKKIATTGHRFEMRSAERFPGTAHMFIVNPLTGNRMDSLFSTHPRVENRIEALIEMAESGEFGPSRSLVEGSTPERRPTGIPTVRRARQRSGPWT